MPPLEVYMDYVSDIWHRSHLTNHGPLVVELEGKLKSYLGVPHLSLVANGTMALQLALNCYGIGDGEVITTPFSYVATVSSILWQGCTPVFVDIDPHTYSINPDDIEARITPKTRAILAVHVFGYPCAVEKIEAIAKAHNLKVIYDGAHGFGCTYKGKSLLSYGDAITCSFHATKLFHMGEGGAVIVPCEQVDQTVQLSRSFGHVNDDHHCLGINGKVSELHAALGLSNFPYIDEIIQERKKIHDWYDLYLQGSLSRPHCPQDFEYNYSYYPVVFSSQEALLRVFKGLAEKNIYPRRYFYPSLNQLPYVPDAQGCPISEDIASRIACLPLYGGLTQEEVKLMGETILAHI